MRMVILVFRMLLLFTAVTAAAAATITATAASTMTAAAVTAATIITTANPPPLPTKPPPMTSPPIDHKIPSYKNHYHIPLHGHPPKLKIPQYYVLPHLPNSPTEDPVKAGKFLKSTSCKPNIFPNPESPIQI